MRPSMLCAGVMGLSCLILAHACTFPDVDVRADAASTGSTGGGGRGTGGGGAGGSGAGTGSGGASGGMGAEGGCDTMGGCDADCDGELAEGACGGDDCNDDDPDVFPGQTGWFETAQASGGFDYNCDGTETLEFPDAVQCSGAICVNAQNVFLTVDGSDVPCGESASFGNCSTLPCNATVTDTKIQRCH